MCRRELQVNEKSAYQWRRAWASGGWEEICHRPPGCDYLLSSDLQTKARRLAGTRAGRTRLEGQSGVGRGKDTHADRTEVPPPLQCLRQHPVGEQHGLHRADAARPAAKRDEAAISAWWKAVWAGGKFSRRPTHSSASRTKQA